MMKAVVYEGENLLGEVEIYLSLSTEQDDNNGGLMRMLKLDGKIRISHYSQSSERCPPLAVLHTITSSSGTSTSGGCMGFKMVESLTQSSLYFRPQDSPIFALHTSCLRDNKTAVVPLGEQEIHLVAMRSRKDGRTPCFWGVCVASGLYESCLGLLNLRCLGIVFDLDETLIVANTLRSFEDRIEGLQRKITVETDPQRLAGMMAEVNRYQDDKAILKQYAETDQVVDNGKVHKIQAEVVPALSDNHQTLVRPLIRLQDKNIVLTRINPQIRDTSVLVRLRPAWEDLRSYLSARGRKRFEVYVCTMAERDYALEMWRLLDPDSNLISTRELLDRIVCVKSGLKKSLFNVFHDGICHPKMALVIDDRLKVWDEEDQPRVHVVPAFAPYYAPQAEANNAIPVLCVARNVACNVRGGFFRDFDEGLLPRISEVMYEDDVKDIPSAPDVSNYLVSEDDGSGSNGNKEQLCFDGMADLEVERRLKEAILASSATLSLPSMSSSAAINLVSRLASSPPFTIATPPITVTQPAPQASVTSYNTNMFSPAPPLSRPLGSTGRQDLTLHSSSGREEGEVPESELDPDTRRRLLILQHGQDVRDTLLNDPSFSVRPPMQAPVAGPALASAPASSPAPGPVAVPSSVQGPVPRVQSRGSWFPVEEHMSARPLNQGVANEFPPAFDGVHVEKRVPPLSFQRKIENSRFDRSFSEKQRQREAVRNDHVKPNHSSPSQQSFEGNKDVDVEHEQGTTLSESRPGALHDIAMRCGTKVEFRAGLAATTELKFTIEVFFSGERIGEGSGVTRKEAQHRAAEAALMNLADRYLTHIKSDPGAPQSDTSGAQSPSGVRFPSDVKSHIDQASVKEETVSPSELTRSDNSNVGNSKNSMGSVSALKELCMKEGLCIDFKTSSPSTNPAQKDETCAAVEIEGQILGKGTGLTWDEAKIQAAEKALVSLKSMLGQFTQKRPASPRLEGIPSKRLKPEYSRVL